MKTNFFAVLLVILTFFITSSSLAHAPISDPAGQVSTWHKTTQGMWGANATALAVSPDFVNDQLLLIGTNRGIFRSIDSGDTWVHAQGIDITIGFSALQFSPSFASDRTVFTWMDDRLYRSTNGGENWSLFYTASANIYALAISPAFTVDHTAVLGTYGQGLYITTDSGATWQPANTGLTDIYVLSAAFSPSYASDHTLFAGTHGKGIFFSTDSGAHWNPLNTGLPQYGGGVYYNISDIFPSPAYNTDHTIFIRVLGYLYRTTNSGTSWTVASGLPTHLHSLVLAPDYPTSHRAYATIHTLGGQKNLYITQNSGDTWSLQTANFNGWKLGMQMNASNEKILFSTSDNAIIRSDDEGLTSDILAAGLDVLAVPSIAISPNFATDGTLLAVGNQHLYRSTNTAQLWAPVTEGFLPDDSAFSVAVSPAFATDQIAFVGAESGVYRSSDGGLTWQISSSGLPGSRVTALAVSPNFTHDHLVFAGLNADNTNIYISRDSGATWNPTGDTFSETVVGFVFSPQFSQDGIIYSLHKGANAVMRTSSGDYSTWVNNGPGHEVIGLALSPGYPADKTIYALTSGTWDGKPCAFFQKTTDDGESWEVIHVFPQEFTATYLLMSPHFAADQTFIVSFYEYGLMRSTDGGETWNAFNAGLSDQEIIFMASAESAASQWIAGTVNQSVWIYGNVEVTPRLFLPFVNVP